MGVSKHGANYIMRQTNHTDEIEDCTLGELLDWVQDLVERNGKEAKFELSSEDDTGESATVYCYLERPATEAEIAKFIEQQKAEQLKTEARERADFERLQAKFAPKN